MSGKDLFEGMSYVDERFVEEAENIMLSKRNNAHWIRAASMAACLCLILFGLYQLRPFWNREPTEGAGQSAADAIPEGGMDAELKEEAQQSVAPADEAEAAIAPEMAIRIQKLTETGFIGTVQNNGGFPVFEYGTEITVTIDPDTDPDFTPEDYQIGDLVYVVYTEWDEEAKTMVASILGIVDEPICD